MRIIQSKTVSGVKKGINKLREIFTSKPGFLNKSLQYIKELEIKVSKKTREVEEIKALLQSAFEQAPFGMIITDAAGKMQRWNKTIHDNPALKNKEIAKLQIADLLQGWEVYDREDKLCLDEDLPHNKVLLLKESVVNKQFKMLYSATKKEYWIQVNAVPLFVKEKFIGSMIVFNNITRQKRYDAEIYRANEFDALSKYASSLAHDSNNLLTSISMINSIIKTSNDITKIHELADTTSETVDKAAHLNSRLFEIAKGGEPKKELSSIKNLIKEAAKIFQYPNYKITFPNDLWQVNVDRVQINQVLINIIKNAEEAMTERGRLGEIVITAENLRISEISRLKLKPGVYVKISISDQGVGISDENRHRIFELFFTTKPKGGGVGLASSYQIIKKHAGLLDLKSIQNVGTDLDIYLPAVITDNELNYKKPLERGIIMGSGSVLIVDDEDDVRNTTCKIMIQAGYKVIDSKSGESAIDLLMELREDYFDLIILDLNIKGGEDGDKILEIINKNRTTKSRIKAILVSGNINSPVVQDYAKYGFAGVVKKPFRAYEITKMVSEILQAGDANNRHNELEDKGYEI